MARHSSQKKRVREAFPIQPGGHEEVRPMIAPRPTPGSPTRGSQPGVPAARTLRGGVERVGVGAPDVPDLDRLIHERMRLGIVSALAVNDSLGFNDLKALLKTTDGNLSVHARKLEDAQYIHCSKYFEGRHPRTEYRLTGAGRRALDRYLNHMDALIRAMRDR